MGRRGFLLKIVKKKKKKKNPKSVSLFTGLSRTFAEKQQRTHDWRPRSIFILVFPHGSSSLTLLAPLIPPLPIPSGFCTLGWSSVASWNSWLCGLTWQACLCRQSPCPFACVWMCLSLYHHLVWMKRALAPSSGFLTEDSLSLLDFKS